MGNKISILIIEDETMTSLRLKQIINNTEFEVLASVTNADDAFECLKNHPVDVVLADVNINGDKSGFDIASVLQDKYTSAIIFITAQKDEDSLRKASRINYSSYIVKPFTEDDVLTALRLATLKHGITPSNRITIANGYEFSKSEKKLFHYNQEIYLTKKEFQLLFLLIQSKNEICSLEHIDQIIWDEKFVTDATRRNLLFKLKQKMQGVNIIGVKGIGYKLMTTTND